MNAAWRSLLGLCAPTPQACRHAPAPGRAAGGPRRGAFCRRRQRYKYSTVVERSPRSHGQRRELVEGPSPRGLSCPCTDKAGYIYSALLYIFRVVVLLLRQRRGAGLGELQQIRGRRKCFATARFLKLESSEWDLIFPLGIHAQAPPVFPVFRAKLPHGASYDSPLLPVFFFSLAPCLQAASLREILHMQAGQCGNPMGTKF